MATGSTAKTYSPPRPSTGTYGSSTATSPVTAVTATTLTSKPVQARRLPRNRVTIDIKVSL